MRGAANKWLGLVAAALGMFLCSLDLAVNVALPDITADLNTDLRTVQWIIVLYVGGSTSLQLGLGSAADVYGLRRFYIIGLAAYALAVLLIGLAPTLPFVLGLRVMQAVGNGLIAASAPALVTGIFPSEQRGRALGLMSAISTLGMIAATLGGGVLVDGFGWRAIFLARVPLTLITILLALIILQAPAASDGRKNFDLRGAALAFVGLAALVLFLTIGGRSGWLSPAALTLGIGAIASLTLFLRWERKIPNPVFDPKMLTHPLLAPRHHGIIPHVHGDIRQPVHTPVLCVRCAESGRQGARLPADAHARNRRRRRAHRRLAIRQDASRLHHHHRTGISPPSQCSGSAH